MEILKTSMTELKQHIDNGDVSCEAVTSAFLEQTKKHNTELNAYITINENAIEQAHELDKRHKAGEKLGKLGGIPIAVKDLLCTRGIRTTAGSKMLHNFVPPYSSTVTEKMDEEDAIVLGKTNLDEFAMGSSNETSYFGPVKNPWDTTRVPGGSSGGSAAAVAARMAPAAIGTDTGGSIRQPSSFTGIVGVKPTYGRVSRFGITAFASSLDQAGPMANNVKDAALLLEAISGRDGQDATSANLPVPNWVESINTNVAGKTVGLLKECFEDGAMTDEVRKVVDNSLNILKDLGVKFKEVSVPAIDTAVPIYYLIATSEASSNLARYDGVRFGHRANFDEIPAENIAEFYARTRAEGFGEEVKRRIMMGAFSLSSGYYDAYYDKACRVRALLRKQYLEALEGCELLFGPVTTSTAFKIGERIDDPIEMYNNDIFTTGCNLAGLPGMSVPAGFSSEGLPVGVQLIGRHFEEQNLFDFGQALEDELKLSEVPSVL
ncbi:MAG: Asp-tRNA(Asn)/Glu-tRNA(Gln) amidotransferase GatCAB subunit A [Bdellovibrionaceae bacterium]|nr:Asp-tRNA(Asn)/Glu-tRNA(Gln) amidotransferase GatCAB subunit A [Pseudobdellovibrionaceae bacterium]|tara:strand:- start:63239 stop:64711 length:1473 start_codon:yes stop_codon:yes gene_type:complete